MVAFAAIGLLAAAVATVDDGEFRVFGKIGVVPERGVEGGANEGGARHAGQDRADKPAERDPPAVILGMGLAIQLYGGLDAQLRPHAPTIRMAINLTVRPGPPYPHLRIHHARQNADPIVWPRKRLCERAAQT